MSDTTDPIVAETQRLYDELHAARADVIDTNSPDAFAKARHNRAQEAVREHRRILRQVGQFVGDRPVSDDKAVQADDARVGIRTADGEAQPPTILEDA